MKLEQEMIEAFMDPLIVAGSIICCILFLMVILKYFGFKPMRVLYKTYIGTQIIILEHNKLSFPEKYKIEVEKYLEKKIPEKYKELDAIIEKAENYYENFTKKPSNELALNEYSNTIEEFEKELKVIDLELHHDLLKITDKHLLLPIGYIYTDSAERYYKIIKPYFNKVDIDDSKLIKFHSYFEQKYEELIEYRVKVMYSISKEEAIKKSLLNKKYRTRSFLIHLEKYGRLA